MKATRQLVLLLLVAFTGVSHAMAQNTFPSSGNVGIGTTTPGAPLDVYGGGTITSFGGGAKGIQARVASSTGSGFWFNSAIYAEQTGPTTGDFVSLTTTGVTSHPSGNVALAIPYSVVHMHNGAGSVGEIHVVDDRLIMTAGSGNITNGIAFYGTLGIFNGATPTNTVQNGYGLYITTFPSNVLNKYGVWINDPTATNYFGGSICIGTTNPQGYQLAVNGSAIFTKAIVKLFANWPDYVFTKNYILPSLHGVEAYVKTNHHLPGLPSAGEVAANGVDLGNNQALLLQKIEELTLYTIQLFKQVEAGNKRAGKLQQQINDLKRQLKK